jgi:hypothetical protein
MDELKLDIAELREALAYLLDDYVVHVDPVCGCYEYEGQLCPYCKANKILGYIDNKYKLSPHAPDLI